MEWFRSQRNFTICTTIKPLSRCCTLSQISWPSWLRGGSLQIGERNRLLVVEKPSTMWCLASQVRLLICGSIPKIYRRSVKMSTRQIIGDIFHGHKTSPVASTLRVLASLSNDCWNRCFYWSLINTNLSLVLQIALPYRHICPQLPSRQ